MRNKLIQKTTRKDWCGSRDEIEIYWKTTYDGTEYDIFNTVLNLQDDKYCLVLKKVDKK